MSGYGEPGTEPEWAGWDNYADPWAAGTIDDALDEPCTHECDEECEDYQGFDCCRHDHCFSCGGCGCPGYCDDYQTYNLRPAETGGQA